MTPRSSWWQSTAERGGGIVVLARNACARCSPRRRRARSSSPPIPAMSSAISGSTILSPAVAGWDRPRPTAARSGCITAPISAPPAARCRWSRRTTNCADWPTAELARAGQPHALAPPDLVPSGETRDIHRAGGRYLTLVGTNKLFHLPQDRWPDAVDVAAIARIAAAASRIVLALTRGTDCRAPASNDSTGQCPAADTRGGNIMAEQNWTLRGEYMESCNCDYLCPCIYTNPQGPATHDHCTAFMVFRIDEGRSGATRLDGLKFALVIRSGKVMADGNWIFGVVVDEAADPAQRQALGAIAERRGRRHPGGDPAEPGRRFPRRRVSADRFRHRRADPPRSRSRGSFRSRSKASLRATAAATRIYIDNTGHPANRRLALARSKETHVHAFGLDLDLGGQGNNGHFAPFSWAA